jgi:hypothetical protein
MKYECGLVWDEIHNNEVSFLKIIEVVRTLLKEHRLNTHGPT